MQLITSKVLLNVYDYTCWNSCLGPLGLGFYHSGVQIEYKIYKRQIDQDGLCSTDPLSVLYPISQQIDVGNICVQTKQFEKLMIQMRNKYPVRNYNLFTNNCNHFAIDLIQRLTKTKAPKFITRSTDCCSCLIYCLPDNLLNGQWALQQQLEQRRRKGLYSELNQD